MLKALSAEAALAIAEISLRRSCDERAMVEYLGVGSSPGRVRNKPMPLPLLKPAAVDLAAFESDERRELKDALTGLTPDARCELIALVWFARSPSLTFERTLRRTQRIPASAQVAYLMGLRLERYVAAGLEKLGSSTSPDRDGY